MSAADFRRALIKLLTALRARTSRVSAAIADPRAVRRVRVRGHWVERFYVKKHYRLRIA